MGKIFYIMGKSSTGKDTIFRNLLKKNSRLNKIVPYTTRPIRAGETDGVEYHFTDEDGLQKIKNEGRLIEIREYNTCHGVWKYFTVADENLDLENADYIMIGTIESYMSVKKYFGSDIVVPLLIELDDGIRLQRAIDREKKQREPKYEELCRRYLADAKDFSADRIKEAGIDRSFYNGNLKNCLNEIMEYIQWTLK